MAQNGCYLDVTWWRCLISSFRPQSMDRNNSVPLSNHFFLLWQRSLQLELQTIQSTLHLLPLLPYTTNSIKRPHMPSNLFPNSNNFYSAFNIVIHYSTVHASCSIYKYRLQMSLYLKILAKCRHMHVTIFQYALFFWVVFAGQFLLCLGLEAKVLKLSSFIWISWIKRISSCLNI